VSLYYSITTFLTYLNSHTKAPNFVNIYFFAHRFETAIQRTKFVTDKSSEDSLILPEDFIEELKHVGLLE